MCLLPVCPCSPLQSVQWPCYTSSQAHDCAGTKANAKAATTAVEVAVPGQVCWLWKITCDNPPVRFKDAQCHQPFSGTTTPPPRHHGGKLTLLSWQQTRGNSYYGGLLLGVNDLKQQHLAAQAARWSADAHRAGYPERPGGQRVDQAARNHRHSQPAPRVAAAATSPVLPPPSATATTERAPTASTRRRVSAQHRQQKQQQHPQQPPDVTETRLRSASDLSVKTSASASSRSFLPPNSPVRTAGMAMRSRRPSPRLAAAALGSLGASRQSRAPRASPQRAVWAQLSAKQSNAHYVPMS